MSVGSGLYRSWKTFGPKGWAWNTHPSESEWKKQQRLWWFKPYYDYMVGQSQNEKNAYTRGLYDINFSDIKYPYLSQVADKSTANVVSGIATSARAIEGLYDQSSRSVRNLGSNRDRRKKNRRYRDRVPKSKSSWKNKDYDFRPGLTWNEIMGFRD